MYLTCKIIEKKGEKVLVEIENQIINLPLNFFPNIENKKQFRLYLWDNEESLTNKNLAKTILEEMLNGK